MAYDKNKNIKLQDILFAPFGCLLQITNPLVFFASTSVVLILIALIFPSVLTDLFSGMIGKSPQFYQNYQIIQYDNENNPYWKIIYQYQSESTFSGKVRHTSVINSLPFPMLSHDILITSGEYADPELVTTSMSNHHFRWSTRLSAKPNGTINLLHIVPANEEIEILLNRINKNDIVTITGVEISRIIKMVDDKEAMFWSDSGCNSILVTSVEILSP